MWVNVKKKQNTFLPTHMKHPIEAHGERPPTKSEWGRNWNHNQVLFYSFFMINQVEVGADQLWVKSTFFLGSE